MKLRICLFIISFLVMQTSLAQNTSFNWQGHRGCRGLMPENTIPAFLKAIDYGVNTLELDVIISKDHQVVVSHDPFFHTDFSIDPAGKALTKGTHINLYQLNYDEIKRYDVGSNGNPNFPEQQKLKTYKPLLSEVIESAEAYRKAHSLPLFLYNIEIKSDDKEYDLSQPQPADFSDLVYTTVARLLPPERVVIQSFDFNVLKHWHKQIQQGAYQKVMLAALVANLKGIEHNLQILGFKPDIYSPYFQLINKKKVEKLHKMGLLVIPWTVNTTEQMQRVKAMGVDGIITDYPNRIPK